MNLFQSTHPHRVRLSIGTRFRPLYLFQSTHPHRVRLNVGVGSTNVTSFNPRTHIGCDKLLPLMQAKVFVFQSTHPHRVRLCGNNDRQNRERFQSTHPHRVRPTRRKRNAAHKRFQSTHPHRVRLSNSRLLYIDCRFNPRTHIGCDRVFSKCLNITLQSYNFCGSLQNNTIKTLIFL